VTIENPHIDDENEFKKRDPFSYWIIRLADPFLFIIIFLFTVILIISIAWGG